MWDVVTPMIAGKDAELRALQSVADMMAVAARTAPKTGGTDSTVVAVITGEEKDKIADEMVLHTRAKTSPLQFFERDAENLRRSPIVVLVGIRGTVPKTSYHFNCGACGFVSCADYACIEKKTGEDFSGPLCIWHAVDLGIAVSSAAKVASVLNVDNRIMYSVGAAAKALNMLEADLVLGIPISASGKNIYFDRR